MLNRHTLKALFYVFALMSLWTEEIASKWVEYEPKMVTLSGKIISRTLPGPPNYSDIKKGDIPEKILFLILDSPISVKAKLSDPALYPSERNIRKVQLWTLNPKVLRQLKQAIGRHVVVTGRLSHAITGHHRLSLIHI